MPLQIWAQNLRYFLSLPIACSVPELGRAREVEERGERRGMGGVGWKEREGKRGEMGDERGRRWKKKKGKAERC